MECEAVRRAISDGDGRVLRARDVRAHLRACSACSEFRALIDSRSAELQALAPPLPAAASASVLAGLVAHAGGGLHAGGAAATSAAGLGSHAAASLALKGITGLAVAAAAGAGAAQLISTTGGPAKRPAHTSRAREGSTAISSRPARPAATSSGTPGPRSKAPARAGGPPQPAPDSADNGRANAQSARGPRGAHGNEKGRGQGTKGVRGAARAGARKRQLGRLRHPAKQHKPARKPHDRAAKEAAETGAHKPTPPPARAPLLPARQPRLLSESP